jgi:rhodanese-related sulfurtransferase
MRWALFFILFSLSAPLCAADDAHDLYVSAREFSALLVKTADAQVVDLRTADETGGKTLAGATLKPFVHGKFTGAIQPIDNKKTLFVYDSDGHSVRRAVHALNRDGYNNVVALSGGIAAWQAAQLPVVDSVKDAWNAVYTAGTSVMGDTPNAFFVEQLSKLPPGRILLPGEGEGRNGVWAAKHGWKVDAFDISENARKLASERAKKNDVNEHYWIADFSDPHAQPETYDAIAVIDVYGFPSVRTRGLQALSHALKPGGILILECFAPDNLKLSEPMGPKRADWLYTLEEIKRDLGDLDIKLLEQKQIVRHEVKDFPAVVVEFIGQKKRN